MLRVLHTAYLQFPSPGIIQQLEQEQEAANQLGLEWKSRLFLPSGVCSDSNIVVRGTTPSSRPISSQMEFYRWVSNEMENFDILLLRNNLGQLLQLPFMIRARKPVFLIHHTMEGPEILSRGTLKSRLRWLLDCLVGPACISKAAGIIAVTGEIGRYELGRVRVAKPLLIYPNGILVRGLLPKPTQVRRSNILEIVFVASSFFPWHGLDRLISAVKSSPDEFIMHIVGDVPSRERADAAGDTRVVFHGRLNAGDIGRLLETCHLGLSSFALDRNKLSEACTLKVREYLSLGLPVYAGHRDVFPDGFPYYRCGPCDMRAILGMARDAVEWNREEILAAATPYIDKSMLVSKLHAQLSSLCESV